MPQNDAARRRGKGGRPRALPDDLRTRSITFACNDREMADLKRLADAAGLQVRVYARQRALSGSDASEEPTLTEELINRSASLARLAADLGAVADAARAGQVPVISADLLERLADAATACGLSLLEPGRAR